MADVIKDIAKDREICFERINELLNIWIELKIHYWAGTKTIDRIPNEHLRYACWESKYLTLFHFEILTYFIIIIIVRGIFFKSYDRE